MIGGERWGDMVQWVSRNACEQKLFCLSKQLLLACIASRSCDRQLFCMHQFHMKVGRTVLANWFRTGILLGCQHDNCMQNMNRSFDGVIMASMGHPRILL